MFTRDPRTFRVLVVLGMLGLSAALASSCAGTRGRRATPPKSGFLRDYSELTHREGYAADLVYINPDAQWSQYNAVYLHSVTIWGDPETAKLKPEERQMLTDFLYRALHEKLSEKFTVVDRAGVGVVIVRAALTGAKGANVVLKTITTVVPQLKVASTIVGVGGDLVATVGEATVEAELLDSLTLDRLAAAVDRRAGRKWYTQLRTWSDVKAACDYWAARLVGFLEKQGVRRKA
jgi:hypothetical protein